MLSHRQMPLHQLYSLMLTGEIQVVLESPVEAHCRG